MRKELFLILLLIICLPVLLLGQYYEQSATGGVVDWTNQMVREIGIGAPNPNMPIAAQRAGAIEAAKRVALRNLLERVKGMYINSEVTIEQYTVTNDIIRNRVEGTVKNFRVIDTRYKSDGSVEVEVEVPLSGLFEVLLPGQMPEGGQMPRADVPTKPADVVYTGLIIDARGLGLRPALAPKIVDESNAEVYGTGNVSRDYAMQIGVVGYEKDLSRAKANERVTNNPLVVKALKVSGTHSTDVVISGRDAGLIQEAGKNLSFLQQCKVMLLLD